MSISLLARNEYQRLCNLIGHPPYSDCQLVALMLHLAVPDSKIVEGNVICDDQREVNHFWVTVNGQDIDPLSEDWESEIYARKQLRVVPSSEILKEYKKFITEFPEPCEYSFFPLRWKVKDYLGGN
mgnify:CR=1 FL=1